MKPFKIRRGTIRRRERHQQFETGFHYDLHYDLHSSTITSRVELIIELILQFVRGLIDSFQSKPVILRFKDHVYNLVYGLKE